jgi:hypothetical protein
VRNIGDRTSCALAVAFALLAGCHPYFRIETHQHHPPLSTECCPRLANPGEALPPGAVAVGRVHCTNHIALRRTCSHRQNMERLRIEACRLGADVAQIDDEEIPDLESGCYWFSATLYRLDAGLDSEVAAPRIADSNRSRCSGGSVAEFRTSTR